MRLVQSARGSTSSAATSFVASFGTPTTAGNTLLAFISTSAGATGNITGIAEGGVWTEIAESGVSGATNTHLSIWMISGAASVTDLTITSASSVTWQVQLVEVFGNTVLDQSVSIFQPGGNTAIHTTNVLAPLVDDCILFAAASIAGTGTVTLSLPSQFIGLTDPAAAGNIHNRTGYWERGDLAYYSATWTTTSASRSTLAILALRQKQWRLTPLYEEEEYLIEAPALRFKLRQGKTAFGAGAPLTVKREPSDAELNSTYVFLGGHVHETADPAVRDLWLNSGFSVEEF